MASPEMTEALPCPLQAMCLDSKELWTSPPPPSRVISGIAQVESKGRKKKACGWQMMVLDLEDLGGQHLMGAAQA